MLCLVSYSQGAPVQINISLNQNQLESSLARRSLTGIPNQVVERKGKIIRKFSYNLTLFEVSISDRLKILNIYKLISPIRGKNVSQVFTCLIKIWHFLSVRL